MSRHPIAPGAPGHNVLILPGLAAVFHGNFDRRAETEATSDETNQRLLRPGAILLANLDINHPIDGARSRAEQLDALDNVVGGGDDSAEMATLKIERPNPANQQSARVVLHVHPDDARRVRLFRSGTTSPVFLGTGKSAQSHETSTAARDFQLELPAAASPFSFHFEVEAVTLPGSPRAPEPRVADDPASPPAPTGAPAAPPSAPLPPAPPPPTFEVFMPDAPATSVVVPPTTTTPIFPNRLPGEVWFRLVYLDHAGNPLPVARDVRDVALFTIAPWLMLSNLHQAEVLYIADLWFNADTIQDVERAMAGTGVTLRKIPEVQVDGDPWVQDEFEIGYCWAVHNWMHVTLHCKRDRSDNGLKKFVRRFLPADDMGLFDDLTEDGDGDPNLSGPLPHGGSDPDPTDSVNYGGNLELSPPVNIDTPALPSGIGGPAVPAQPRSPFGKILIGDHPRRPIDVHFRRFLEAQMIQPVLPLNTSWLDVGHVDEFMCFVPSSTGRGFRLVIASVHVATQLLEAMKALNDSDPVLHPLTKMHRGKSFVDDLPQTTPRTSDESESVNDVLVIHQVINDIFVDGILSELEQRLKDGCDVRDDEVIHLPVYFNGDSAILTTTSAFTPDVANLQVVNHHVLVPRPFGARMNLADAGSILRTVGGLASATDTRLRPFLKHEFWVFRGEKVSDIAGFFADGGVTESAVRSANPGKFDGSGKVIAAMTRLLIPEDTVDLFEAFTQISLEDAGLTVHLVDDWYTYHRNEGEIHCGTNVKRRPPELDASSGFEFWWDHYADLVR